MSGWGASEADAGGGTGGWGGGDTAASPSVPGAFGEQENFGSDGGRGDGGGADSSANNDDMGGGAPEFGEFGAPQSDVTCRTCNKEGHFSKDCPDRGPPPGPCRWCKKTEHWSSECPEKPEGPEPCLRCDETNHRIRDCPQPVTCHLCNQEGHISKECPSIVCKNCEETGHKLVDCTNPRKIDRSGIADVSGEQAWAEITAAAKDRDIDDLKAAIAKYVKALPDTTYTVLEKAFRTQNVGVYIICLERDHMASTLTNMDLQGNLRKKFTISYRFNQKPSRPRERKSWPTPEQNLERLEDCGESVSLNIPKCTNCEELGHTAKLCPQEKVERTDKVEIMCVLCEAPGHRARDCPEERPSRGPKECRNCGSTEHIAKECDQPRKAGDDVECHKCHELGHFSRDCPSAGGGSRSCYNCGGEGHISKGCPEPRKPRQNRGDPGGFGSGDGGGSGDKYGETPAADATGDDDEFEPQPITVPADTDPWGTTTGGGW